ncbi:MAG: V-type ATPase subunit [Oscillospiraceae bacterium]|nr:V-type ATPase subunit [Oscillospiraceae bacterium]
MRGDVMRKPLKDTDFLNAAMHVRALERNLLNRERVERMLEAKSHEDAAKVLYECGYGEMSSVTAEEWERVIAEERDAAYRLIGSLSGVSELSDVFRMKYDYHNVKTIIKSEVTGEDPTPLLIGAGRMPVEKLIEAMRDRVYGELPGDLKLCVIEAREVLARTGDPQTADFMLDRNCIAEMRKAAENSGSGFLAEYVRMFTDVYNLRAVVRTARLAREPDFLRTVLVDGGGVSASRLIGVITAGGALEEVYAATPLYEAAAAGVRSAKGGVSMTAFERLADNALLRTLTRAKSVAFGEQPLIGFLGAKESEFTTIRTILSGRVAGVAPEALRERLRDCYV